MNIGVFTTIKIIGGIPLFFEQHQNRLISEAKTLKLGNITLTVQDVKIYLENNNLSNCALKIIVSKEKNKTIIKMETRPLPPQNETIKLITVDDKRNKYKTIKSTDRTINNQVKNFAKKHNADDAIFMKDKTLIESTIANIFSINKHGDIITPPLDAKGLKGIVRKIIMKNLNVLEEEIPENTNQPIILTNSLRIQKVTHLNGKKLKNADKLFQQIKTVLEKAETKYLNMRGVVAEEGFPTARTPRSAGALTGRKLPTGPRVINTYIKELSKWTEPEEIFLKLFSNASSSFWLDSSLTNETSRFSYMGIPEKIITYSLPQNTITIKTKNKTEKIKQNIFDFLEYQLAKQNIKQTKLPFDFIGGYVGYFGYELKKLTGSKTAFKSPYPDSLWFYTNKTIVFDHKEKKVYLVCLTENKKNADDWFKKTEEKYYIKRGVTAVEGFPIARSEISIERARREGTAGRTPRDTKINFKLDRDHTQYLKDIQICKKYLKYGESYQICLTNKLTAKGEVNPLDLYLKLRKTNPAPYAAFIKYADLAILSSSPEEFLKIDERDIQTKPIKGTIRRGEYPQEDQLLIKQLSESKKDWSENAMIVDLLRNDLGKVSKFGSVKVTKLMNIESYQTVHQLVSTVTGKLRKDKSIIDTVKATFPGGSMTGAPKIHTMEIIDEVEQKARGIYSGSIGFLSLNQKARLNIVIRTIIIHKNQLSIGAGGAILIDSDPEKEYEEMRLKANVLMQTTLNMYNPTMHNVYLALGSNIGNKKDNMDKAINLLSQHISNITVAKFYETKPMYYEKQENFLNSALRGQTSLSPRELLTFVKKLEKEIGRKKRFPNGPREIDIDILFYDDIIFKDEHVQIPHPRIEERDFVLKPLMDLNPEFIHPVLKKSIKKLFDKQKTG